MKREVSTGVSPVGSGIPIHHRILRFLDRRGIFFGHAPSGPAKVATHRPISEYLTTQPSLQIDGDKGREAEDKARKARPPWSHRGYSLLREHKRGGLGSIWVARDHRTRRVVALKELRRELSRDPHAQLLFRNEAYVTAELQHPNIVPVYDVSARDDEAFYYTMRFVNGRTLSEQIEAGIPGGVELRRLLNVFRDICSAMAYAHSMGVVHLDLKPTNVVVGEFDEVILLDWGCARRFRDLAEARSDGDTRIVGTPAYMAPEQVHGRDRKISPATDIYQLGAILFEILTGQPPHAIRSVTAMVRRIKRSSERVDWADNVKTLNSRASPELAAICGKAMEEDPGRRYATVTELSQDVERWMADQPVSVLQVGPVTGSVRWVRRHQKLTTLLLATACLFTLFQLQLLRLGIQDRCDQLAHGLSREIALRVGCLDALRSFFEVRGEATRSEFGALVRPFLDEHRQIMAFEWVPVIPASERRSREAQVRSGRWPSPSAATAFTFTERDQDGRFVSAGERDAYYPVYYVEPYIGNEVAFGFDLGSSPARLHSLRSSARTGETRITAPIDLVQEDRGLLALSPVRFPTQAAGAIEPDGYVLGVLTASGIVTSAWPEADLGHFVIDVLDVTDPSAPVAVWSNSTREASTDPSLFGAVRDLQLWGRTWRIVLRPTATFVLSYPFSSSR